MEMTGACLFCGQTRIVEAESQREADRLASELCTCDNSLKKARQLWDNIDQLCGETARSYGMDIVAEEVKEELKQIGTLCIHGLVEAATIRISDSSITIKQVKDGVSITRKKVLSAKLEA